MSKAEKLAKALAEARIQRAVSGFQIPMLAIPAMYVALEASIADGSDDADLKEIVREWPGVKESV